MHINNFAHFICYFIFSIFLFSIFRPNDSIVHLKFTLLLLPGGNIKITGLPIPNFIVSEKTISDEIKTVLEENPEKKKKDRKKKSNAKKGKYTSIIYIFIKVYLFLMPFLCYLLF